MEQARYSVPGRVLVVLVSLALVGCDGGAQRESQFQRLVRSWTVRTLEVDDFDFTSSLNETYDDVEVTFSSTGEGLGSYEMRGTNDGRTVLTVRGTARLVNDSMLALESGFARRVFWTFEFETSGRLTLRSLEERNSGTTEFLQRLLPGQSWGEKPDVELRLQAADG